MYALRKTRWLVVFGLFAALAVGFAASDAAASGCHGYGYSYAGYTPKYAPAYCAYPGYANYGASYDYDCYLPAVQYCATPYCYPVTSYDCYGRPYVVWQTGYNTVR